jgi:HEPN domain-containing protein
MNADSAKLILLAARRFASAADLLNRSRNPDLLIPSSVNAALALELLFKCLYLIDTGKKFGKTHDFSKIFSHLRPTTQKSLEAAFDSLLRQRDMSDVARIEKESGVKVPRNLLENLQQGSKVFVEGRYIFEAGTPWAFMFYPETKRILLDHIFQLRPDLRT